MLSNFDAKTLKAVHWLLTTSARREFGVFIEYLASEGKRLDVTNRTVKDEVVMRWNQGGSQGLNELVDKVQNAGVDLTKVMELEQRRKLAVPGKHWTD